MIHITQNNLFEILKKFVPTNPLIIEAGAFTGKDTKKLSQTFPTGTIYAFEPVPEIFEQLQKNTKQLKNVTCFNLALSNTTGTETFYISEHPEKPGKPFQAGSLKRPKERLSWSPVVYPRTITVNTSTIDDWAKKNSISKIDFLWLDLQGHELDVIKASPTILKTVSVIYTEVEFTHAYENQYTYAHVKDWMKQNNFKLIGKDFKDQTGWFYGNALFVRN